MNFDFSDDQNMLRDEVRKFLVKESPVAVARRVIDEGTTHAEAAWQGLGSLGVTTLMLPESCGGIGLGAMELCVVAEEVGRQLGALPLASTLYLATQAVLLGASEAQQQRWLPRVAEGTVATLAAPQDDVNAPAEVSGDRHTVMLPVFDGHTLTGSAPLVPDGGCAAFAVVLARNTAGQPCLVLAELTEGVRRQPLKTLDPAKPFAALEFVATPAEALDGVAAGPAALQLLTRVRQRAAILLAFEQLGGADAALEMSAAYARERKAFGRTIGSYQGIKHKLADIYTQNQLARAHCLYGAWALTADAASPTGAPELALAAACARVAATEAYSLAAQENIQVHGGMGYTWELDCHLHYRRARQLAVQLGSAHVWREILAAELEARLDTPAVAVQRGPVLPGSMDFDDSPEEAAFRLECRTWLDAHATLKARNDDFFGPDLSPSARMQAARDWQARKAAAGFGAITWPLALGGRGGTPMQELIWRQEEGRYNVPTSFFNVSLGMVIPSVMAHASDAVRAAHIAPALTGQHLWCQLLSEPGAGSDLGMVRTRAERCTDGREGWLLNGQKVWTSLAQFAQYGLVLARTDPALPKFDGLSTFFIEMNSPGVTVRPIRQAGGESEFNEVFFEDVFVPGDALLGGEEGKGFATAMQSLDNGRLSVAGMGVGMGRRALDTAIRYATERKAFGEPIANFQLIQQMLADSEIEIYAAEAMMKDVTARADRGENILVKAAAFKVFASEMCGRVVDRVVQVYGGAGYLAEYDAERFFRDARIYRIYEGTTQILQLQIAKHMLREWAANA